MDGGGVDHPCVQNHQDIFAKLQVETCQHRHEGDVITPLTGSCIYLTQRTIAVWQDAASFSRAKGLGGAVQELGDIRRWMAHLIGMRDDTLIASSYGQVVRGVLAYRICAAVA